MTSFEVAHIREQGVDLVIVLVDPSFGHKTRIGSLPVKCC